MISTDRSGEVGVRTTEQVKLSVEHADVAVMVPWTGCNR